MVSWDYLILYDHRGSPIQGKKVILFINSLKEVLEKTLNTEIQETEGYGRFSIKSRSLLENLLRKDYKERCSSREALDSSWFKSKDGLVKVNTANDTPKDKAGLKDSNVISFLNCYISVFKPIKVQRRRVSCTISSIKKKI